MCPHASPSQAIAALRHEWLTLADTPLPWSLTGTASVTAGDLVDAITSSPHHDALLHQLLTLHRDGEQLAGRIVLQAMLGRANRLTRTAAGRGQDADDAVAGLWTAIATYPLHRTAHVAANLAMDALKAMSPAEGETPLSPEVLEGQIHDDQGAGRLTPRSPSASEEAVTVLLWALDHQVLTQDEVQLLAHTYLGEGYRDTTAHAELSGAAARQRRSRAVRKLAAAVAAAA